MPALHYAMSVDDRYVRSRARRRVARIIIVCTALVLAVVLCEAFGSNPDPIRSEFGYPGSAWLMLGIAIAFDVLFFFLGTPLLRWKIRQKHVAVGDHLVSVEFDFPRTIRFTRDQPLLLSKDVDRGRWMLRSGIKPRKALKIPIEAFPSLDVFLKYYLGDLITCPD